MDSRSYDLAIIGGGINGLGIALDATLRGLRVFLCEKNDFASGTSSASSKLIHGGLRYLEYYEFSLVRKALKERETLLKIAPHLVKPMEFLLPHMPAMRSRWLILAGLFLYDHLGGKISLPKSKMVNLQKRKPNPLKDTIEYGFSYYDCWVDDARLVIELAIAAKKEGAQIHNYLSCKKAEYQDGQWTLALEGSLNKEPMTVHAKALVNAAGPWSSELSKNISGARIENIILDKGSHIIIPKIYEGKEAYTLQNSDKRIVFLIPYEDNFTLIGTTEKRLSVMEETPVISPAEIDYLLNSVNAYLKSPLTEKDIVHSYSGVRPLLASDEKNPAALTRDYHLSLLETHPLLTVDGGKLTTYRQLAEDALDKLAIFFPYLKACTTKSYRLPGSSGYQANLINQYQSDYPWLPIKLLERFIRFYGTRTSALLAHCKHLNDLGKMEANGLSEREITFLKETEFAQTQEDILWRRTKLGLIK